MIVIGWAQLEIQTSPHAGAPDGGRLPRDLDDLQPVVRLGTETLAEDIDHDLAP
jgi:hypothetical protein